MKPFMSEPEKNVGSKEVQMLEENDILLLEKKQAKTQEKIEEVDEKIKVWTENHEAFKKEREPIDLQTSTGEFYSWIDQKDCGWRNRKFHWYAIWQHIQSGYRGIKEDGSQKWILIENSL